MSNTPNFNLGKPAETDIYNVEVQNGNMDIIDQEMHKPPLTVNGIAPDSTTRDLTITEVPLAGNLSSDIAQISSGEFVERTSGGSASIEDGKAFLTSIKGNMVLSGYVAQSITTTSTGNFDVSVNESTFVGQASGSGTYSFEYTSSWSPDIASYGISTSGSAPVNGDTITVVYVAENLGTFTATTPATFNSTGWNLYNNADGVKYAKVVRYSDEYGYRIGGNYSLIEFSATVSGQRSAVELEDNLFNVPSDGYIFVTGGDATTYIYPTWTDWTDAYEGEFETYSVDVINLTTAMTNFPNGMFAVGLVRDELNLNAQTAIHRIERLENNSTNLANVIASGVDYVVDANYIYAVMTTPTTETIDIDGEYDVSDHGIEFLTGTSVPAIVDVLYGENLKDKLRTDVLTISAQTLDASQKAQVQANLGLVPTTATNKTTAGFVADAQVIKTLNDNKMNNLTGSTSAASSSSVTLTLGTSKRYLVVVNCTDNNAKCLIIAATNSSGAVSAIKVNTASAITLDVNTNNKLKISNSASYAAAVYPIELSALY